MDAHEKMEDCDTDVQTVDGEKYRYAVRECSLGLTVTGDESGSKACRSQLSEQY